MDNKPEFLSEITQYVEDTLPSDAEYPVKLSAAFRKFLEEKGIVLPNEKE